jgi:hypothetical protein
LRIGFPHSEICGSKSARLSPQLIAACYVLHRLCAPRHPPDALALTLDRSAFVPCPEIKPARGRLRMKLLLPRWYFAISIWCLSDPPVVQTGKSRLHNVKYPNQVAWVTLAGSKLFSFPSFKRCLHQLRWWSRSGSNRRPEACKATALPTELRPRIKIRWWARNELNVRPHAYQACALTT